MNRLPNGNESDTSHSGWYDEMGATADQLFVVSTYTDFERLAHGPRGTESKHPLYVYRFHPADGSMVLLHVLDRKECDVVVNPAFSRVHAALDVLYTCTEDIENNGQIFAYSILPNGKLIKIGQADAGGTSTCYLTIDKAQRHIIATNYWNSTLTVIPICPKKGEFTGSVKSVHDPNHGKKVVAAPKKCGGVNHSHNDESTVKQRQSDPHSHALVLDPFVGCVAYVPDLGKDLIREILYHPEDGNLMMELAVLPSGLCTGMPDGPRYIEFHPFLETAYVVNELSSTIAVFSVNKLKLQEIRRALFAQETMDSFKGESTLKLVQSISTLPEAFPQSLNTCGRVCVHPSGRFVVVSNRGHESITIYRVCIHGTKNRGKLKQIGFFHTRGETPRHFQFDSSGQYLIVANQDSDCISVFSFNLSSGEIKFTGNTYHVPSPNFVCCFPVMDRQDRNPQEFGSPLTTLNVAEATELKGALDRHLNMEISQSTVDVTRQISSLTVERKDDGSVDTDSGELPVKLEEGNFVPLNSAVDEEKRLLLANLDAAKNEIVELKKIVSDLKKT